MKYFNVTGMSCAACSSRVEKAVNAVDGVEACSVSLLTNSMSVEGSASEEAIISAVTAAGYGASLKGAEKQRAQSEAEKGARPILIRLIISVVLILPLMYLSMGLWWSTKNSL